MSNFNFDPAKHCYTLDGELLPGVTTVLGTLAKPALIQWAANMAVESLWGYAVDKNKDGKIDLKELEEGLELAKKAHVKKKDKASEQGTDVHALCEQYVKACIARGGNAGAAGAGDASSNEQLMKFVTWAQDNKLVFHESEKRLYSPLHKFAGTVDFTCTMNDKRLVGDIKTTSGIYDLSPFLQVAAYRICLEEMGEPQYDGGVIIRLGKDGSFEEAYRYDAGDDMDTFLALLKVYKAMTKYKNQK